jgi:hypothetical protein
MAITINGSGTISGITAGGLPDGAVTADDIASTLDLSGKTVTLPAGTGGKVLQVVYSYTNTDVINTSGTWVTTAISASITPTSTSSKVLVIVNIPYQINPSSTNVEAAFMLGSSSNSNLIKAWVRNHDYGSSGILSWGNCPITYLDSPSTTSSHTYAIQSWLAAGSSVSVTDGRTGTMTLMEIAA